MALYIVNQPTNKTSALIDCLTIANASDAVLLIEDGVLAIDQDLPLLISASAHIYVLQEDIIKNTLKINTHNSFQVIDYAGFVGLCEKNNPISSWF